MSPHILSQAGFKTSGRYTERVSSFEPVHMLVERQYCPSKQPSPDGVLVCLMCGGYMEQLRWSGPGSTLWYMEREAAAQIGGVPPSTQDIVDE